MSAAAGQIKAFSLELDLQNQILTRDSIAMKTFDFQFPGDFLFHGFTCRTCIFVLGI